MDEYYPKVINKTIPIGNYLNDMGNGPACTSRLRCCYVLILVTSFSESGMRTGSLMLRRSQRGGNAREWISSALMSFGLLLIVLSVPSTAAGFSLFGPNLDPVKDLLADPYSAKFEKVQTVRPGVICGTVNSKNQYAAYTGPKLFAIVNGKGYFAETSPEEVGLQCVYARDCKDAECVQEVVSARAQKERDRQMEPKARDLRGKVQATCTAKVAEDPSGAISCSNALVTCRASAGVEAEVDCLTATLGKYGR